MPQEAKMICEDSNFVETFAIFAFAGGGGGGYPRRSVFWVVADHDAATAFASPGVAVVDFGCEMLRFSCGQSCCYRYHVTGSCAVDAQ
jgi:hypothetical protein